MFYLTTHSTHFIYGYMASDIWLRTILIVRKETCHSHMGYSYRLTARVLLYAPSHRQDNTYHSLCYTSRGALAGTRNSSMGPPHDLLKYDKLKLLHSGHEHDKKEKLILYLINTSAYFDYRWNWIYTEYSAPVNKCNTYDFSVWCTPPNKSPFHAFTFLWHPIADLFFMLWCC